MTKENIRRDIVKDALTEKVKDVFFELSTNWIEFDTETEAFNFITVIRELIKEYGLSENLLNKVCLFSSTGKCFACMESNKEIVMINATFHGKNIKLISVL